jgi:hypothetical protein
MYDLEQRMIVTYAFVDNRKPDYISNHNWRYELVLYGYLVSSLPSGLGKSKIYKLFTQFHYPKNYIPPRSGYIVNAKFVMLGQGSGTPN